MSPKTMMESGNKINYIFRIPSQIQRDTLKAQAFFSESKHVISHFVGCAALLGVGFGSCFPILQHLTALQLHLG